MIESAASLHDLVIDCQTCGASMTVQAHLRTAQCPYCDSSSVVERPPAPDRPRPVFVLSFRLDHEDAMARARRWLRTRNFFARSGLKEAVPKNVRGVYVPAYLYGAAAATRYEAQIGENYTETETYTTTDSKGKSVTRTRTVIKTEWRHLSGMHETWRQDVLVTASRGLANEELERIEPFDLRCLRRYRAAALSGWIAEEASRTRDECLRLAHDESLEAIGRELNAFLPGDSHTGLAYETRLDNEIADLVLLPVWIFAVRYAEDRKPVRLLINGQTGEVYGKVPYSPLKIALGVVALLAVLAVIAFFVLGVVALA